MEILIGSKNPSKIIAIENAAKRCVYFKDQKISIEGMSIDSGISDMPLSLEETMNGAKNRALNIKNTGKKADFYVGIEGGVTIIQDRAFLTSVISIVNSEGQLHYGISPLQEAPLKWKKEIYENGISLGNLTDRETNRLHTREQEGATGVLSDMMMTRSGNFEQAFKCAIAPFYNEYYK